MDIVFHIGTNKTGTSTVQGFLDRNPEFLRRHGWVYPRTGRESETHHTSLAHTPENLLPQAVSDIEKEAQGCGIIISSEYFHTIDPTTFLDAFSAHNISTVVFLRDHVSYFSSWYREAIKSENKTYSFWDFITLVYRPYSAWLHMWPNLTVINYDRKNLINQSVVDHFIQILNFQTPPPPNQQDENVSISGNLLFAKQIINNVITNEQKYMLRSEMQNLLCIDPTFSGSMHITDREFEYLTQRYEADKIEVLDSYGIDLTPPAAAKDGSLSPDMSRWQEDTSTLLSYSRENDYLFGKLLFDTFRTNF
jgi:hypothetical protein